VAEASTPSGTVSCVACRESIRPGASVCHHCGATQHPSRWKIVSDTLKWTGGIVTVISLVVGTVTLAGYYQDWREKNSVIDELVAASEWLIRTHHYRQAWDAYQQALELNPGSTQVRHGQFELAQIWLRDFDADKESADRLLTDIGAVLVRGLPSANPEEAATILAHMGWVQVQRADRELLVHGDIELLFEEALKHDDVNAYANAMYGYWSLIRYGPRDADTVRDQEVRFDKALRDSRTQDYVRRLQLISFRVHAKGQEYEKDRAALAALLRAAWSMQLNGEPLPSERAIADISRAYGAGGRAGNVEASLDALPVDDHLAVHLWLFGDPIEQSSRSYDAQTKYVRARLFEAAGDAPAALEQYQALLATADTRARVDGLVDAAVERLTGRVPERALARTYIADPIDERAPWAFHLETLANFDPIYRSTNLEQARAFILSELEKSNERVPEASVLLPAAIERVQVVVREGDEHARIDGWHLAYSTFNYQLAIDNLTSLVTLYSLLLLEIGDFDRSVVLLDDLDRRVEKLGDEWVSTRAYISYHRAQAHAARAAHTGDEEDVDLAVRYLGDAVEGGVFDAGEASWSDVKGDDFAQLRGVAGYEDLIRGR
jgi:tetratricopeptide (TPR) repeat protein